MIVCIIKPLHIVTTRLSNSPASLNPINHRADRFQHSTRGKYTRSDPHLGLQVWLARLANSNAAICMGLINSSSLGCGGGWGGGGGGGGDSFPPSPFAKYGTVSSMKQLEECREDILHAALH